MKKERDLFDIIKEAQEELLNPPKMSDDEILFGKDGKPISHHRCNICDYLFSNSELLEDPDLGLICEDCNDNKAELEQEQEDLATLIQEEKNSKCLP